MKLSSSFFFKHFLCNNIGNYPRIYINFNKIYLNSVDIVCKSYKKFVYENASERMKTRYANKINDSKYLHEF